MTPDPHIHVERGPHAIRYTCDCGWRGTPRPYGDHDFAVHTEAMRHQGTHLHKAAGNPPAGPAPDPGVPGAGPTPHQEDPRP